MWVSVEILHHPDEGEKVKKPNQQSRSGWGGKRAGAGAPYGNMNAVQHGERSRRAFFPIGESEDHEQSIPPILALRIRNLLLAEHMGRMQEEGRFFAGSPSDWREQMLLDGMFWQHTKKLMRFERQAANLEIAIAYAALSEAKMEQARALTELVDLRISAAR